MTLEKETYADFDDAKDKRAILKNLLIKQKTLNWKREALFATEKVKEAMDQMVKWLQPFVDDDLLSVGTSQTKSIGLKVDEEVKSTVRLPIVVIKTPCTTVQLECLDIKAKEKTGIKEIIISVGFPDNSSKAGALLHTSFAYYCVSFYPNSDTTNKWVMDYSGESDFTEKNFLQKITVLLQA
jgi:hypothetical protein